MILRTLTLMRKHWRSKRLNSFWHNGKPHNSKQLCLSRIKTAKRKLVSDTMTLNKSRIIRTSP